MTVTVNNVQVEFHLNPPKVTFLQGASMVIDDVRDNLRTIEESSEGRLSAFPAICTASGNEPFTVDGSVTNALTVTILPPYVIQFEAGAVPFQSSVGNILGTFIDSPGAIVQINNAVGSLNLQNDQVEYSSFAGGIHIDTINGYQYVPAAMSDLVGSPQRKVDNIPDAALIQASRGLPKVLFVYGDLTAGLGDILDGWRIIGVSTENIITLEVDSSFTDCYYESVFLIGALFGTTQAHDCEIGTVTGAHGEFHGCGIENATVTLQAGLDLHVVNGSHSRVIGAGTATFDCNGSGNLGIRGYTGGLTITNKTSGSVSIDLQSGSITFDATCTSTTQSPVRGTGKLTNNGTINIDDSGLISTRELRNASYGGQVTIDATNGTDGTDYDIGTFQNPVKTFTDAQTIMANEGLPTKLRVRGNLTIAAGESISGYDIIGDGATLNISNTVLTFEDTSSTHKAVIKDCEVTGFQGGENIYRRCMINELQDFHCIFIDCGIKDGASTTNGVWSMKQSTGPGASHTTYFKNCYSDEGEAVINRTGADETMRFDGWHGDIKFINMDSATAGNVYLHVNGGHVHIDSSCTEGAIHISGDFELENESGGTVVHTGLLQSIQDVRFAVEMLRSTHQASGKVFYVNQSTGLPNATGESQETAMQSFADAHAACVDGRGDTIQFFGFYTHTEDMVCTKNSIYIRSIGRNIDFKPATNGGAILTIGDAAGTNGYFCSVEAMLLDGDRGAGTSAANCLVINGKFCLIGAMWLKQSTDSCLLIRGGDYHVINDAEIEKTNTHGIETVDAGLASGSPREISLIGRNHIYLCDGDGIHLGATASGIPNTTRIMRLYKGLIHANVGYGIHADADVDRLYIGPDIKTFDNTAGDLNILTTSVENQQSQSVDTNAIAVAVETQLLDDFANAVDTAAIASAVEAQLVDDFAGITVDNSAIAAAVESALTDEFTTINNAIGLIPDNTYSRFNTRLNFIEAEINAIPADVEAQLADDFAGISVTIDNAAIAAAVWSADVTTYSLATNTTGKKLYDGTTGAVTVDNVAIAAAVESRLTDEFASLESKADTVITNTGTSIPGQIAALNDFNPLLDTVANVTLVDTVTTNTDMRGTDGAYTGTPPTEVQIRTEIDANSTRLSQAATDATTIQTLINNLNDFNPTTDNVANVLNVVTNADMRGTDNVDVAGLATAMDRIFDIYKAQFRRRFIDTGANTITLYQADGITPEFIFDIDAQLTDIDPNNFTPD